MNPMTKLGQPCRVDYFLRLCEYVRMVSIHVLFLFRNCVGVHIGMEPSAPLGSPQGLLHTKFYFGTYSDQKLHRFRFKIDVSDVRMKLISSRPLFESTL